MTLREVSYADIANEMVYEAAIGAVGAFAFAKSSVTAVRNPELLLLTYPVLNMMQPLVCYSTLGGLDGMLKRRANWLGPMISTAIFGAALFHLTAPIHNITLSPGAKGLAVYSVAMLALAKGSARFVRTQKYRDKPITPTTYPSLKPLVVDLPCAVASTVQSVYSSIKNSQAVKTVSDKVYWTFKRWTDTACTEVPPEQKEVLEKIA